jgi:hypothetical protein
MIPFEGARLPLGNAAGGQLCLRQLKTGALRAKYQQLFRMPSASWNRQFLFRRIAWRLQARIEGDLSERARRRAAEIADDADLRIKAPKQFVAELHTERPLERARSLLRRDWRLPRAGTVLTRRYRGQSVMVLVGDDGFEYQGKRYRSLSAIVREVTGTRWNGLAFFGLTEPRRG